MRAIPIKRHSSHKGTLQGRLVGAIIYFRVASALSAIAAVVATIFASYLIAAIGAATCIVLALSALGLAALKKPETSLIEPPKIEPPKTPTEELNPISNSDKEELFKMRSKN